MKPVNLAPGDAPVVVASGGKPNLGMIGGAIFGVVAIVAVAGYFAMARVESVKSETTAANEAATNATSETEAVRAQVASLGQPVVDSDKQLAQGQEQIVVSAYTERHDFVQLAQELRGIMQGTGGWYEQIEATSAGSSDGKAVKITGVMPTEELAASFEERVNATRTLDDAEITTLESVRLTEIKSRKRGTYWKFSIEANLVDTEAPFVAGSSPSDATGTTVGDGSGGGDSLTLSLEPKPKPKAATNAPKQPAKPKNPFDVAASAARGGGA